jgi:NAD(P)H-flavin reductase
MYPTLKEVLEIEMQVTFIYCLESGTQNLMEEMESIKHSTQF